MIPAVTAPTLFTLPPGLEEAGAVLSADGLYRYSLSRKWDAGPLVTWVGLNPSTADAHVDDPTIRRMIGFSSAWRCGRLAVVNLFGWRATSPADLLLSPDPVGVENVASIDLWLRRAHLVVACWGANAAAPRLRCFAMVAEVERIARDAGKPLLCMGANADGSPRHPLYLKTDTALEPWRA